jgi:hypothetical protein
VEVQGLAAEASEIETRSKAGDLVTHASDSTTKKRVGKFNVAGIHFNKEAPLPLPVVPVAGEARGDVAEQAALGFEILAAASNPPKEPADLYKEVDLHMSDSVKHNKFLAEDVPLLFNLDHVVGQVFCATHTGLGFCRSLNSSIHSIEEKLGINNVMEGFLVQIEYESKNGSMVGQFVDCATRFVGMELKHKPWNRGEEFKRFCADQKKPYEMFLYKDERFGCFPKACAVVLFSQDMIQEFLLQNPSIDNRLACLVRDIYEQEYAKLAMAVVAVFGLQLVEPFHAITISKKSTHNSLQIFFKDLYRKMSEPITSDFFLLEDAYYPGIKKELFEDVKKGYKEHVVDHIKNYVKEFQDEAIKLANYFQPDLQTTLARQRRDYGVSDEFEAEHPVDNLSEQARENAPVHNLAMENFCGKVGHRTAKNKHLEATSRSMIIQGTKELREKYGNFREFGQAVKRVKDIKLNWANKQETLAGKKIDQKQAESLKVEGRVLKQLEELKICGGPFTSCSEIDNYLARNDLTDQTIKRRMKMEVQYARDTSRSIPRSNPVFKIRATVKKGQKSHELSSLEFGENLKSLIAKKCAASGKAISITSFISDMYS